MPDAGSPHTHPDDYPKLGLDFERDNAAVPAEKRGPAGPEDERLASEICQRLEQNQFVEASRIAVQVSGGEVTLEGIVENRYARERAEQLARESEGVQSVDNRIRIQVQEDATGGPVLTVRDPAGADEPSTQRS
jgi:hypothetical protein